MKLPKRKKPMNSDVAASSVIKLKRFRSPKTVISRFVFRRTVRSALLWAVVFGIYVASKAIGFVDLYPTAAARQKIAETFSSNIGIELILGRAPHSATTAAYVAWNTGGIMVIIGAIWALLLATKYLRGEEDSGRAEVLLSGQTTQRRAALGIISGIGLSLAAFYAVIAALFILVGKSHGVDFNVSASLFFALSIILGITIFMLIGALASQLMPTRSRAASVSAVILGVFFLMKAIGDITKLHWLLYITPLGWVEKLQPLSSTKPLWLIPILAAILILGSLTIYFAGRRDLGDSIIADKATAKARLGLLNSPLGAAIRLTRSNSIGWLSGVFVSAALYGLITKSTDQVLSQSKGFEKAITRLAQQSRLSSELSFLGIVFFLQMVIVMTYAASSVAAIRREEADGFIDNYLVQPFSRLRWLVGRLFITVGVTILAGLLTALGAWIGLASQHIAISVHILLSASLNLLVPGFLAAGVGIFAFGIRPRLTSMLAYAVLAWSFLIDMVGSGLNLNHWVLDSSVFHQVALAPAVTPNWTTNLIIIIVAIILCLIGALFFNKRDIEGE